MSYAVQTPVQAAVPRRPVTVQLAAALLALMGLVGLGYAVATIAVAPGVVDRFRAAAGPADSGDVDAYVTGVWMVAALGAVLAVILFALYIVLALGLRRGSQASRVGTWVVCGLGLLFGCGTTFTVARPAVRHGRPGGAGLRVVGCLSRVLDHAQRVPGRRADARISGRGDVAGGQPGWVLRAGYSFRVAKPGRRRLCHIADLRLGECVLPGSFPAVRRRRFRRRRPLRTMTTGRVRPVEGCAAGHSARANIDGRASPERVALHP